MNISLNPSIYHRQFIKIYLYLYFIFSRPLFCVLKEITAESPRGGVDIKRIYGEWTTSYLLIRNANIADSGVYTCAPAGGSQTNIKVHVFLHGKIIITVTNVLSHFHMCLFRKTFVYR